MQATQPAHGFLNKLVGPIQRAWRRVGLVVLLLLALLLTCGLILMCIAALYQYIDPSSAGERNEFARTIAQIAGALALSGGLYFTWKTLIENQRANRERERAAQEGLITDRYTKAIEQLGATDSEGRPRLELRLGGIYALQRIARDSERDHWPILQILTTYIRTNAPFRPTDYQQMMLMWQGGQAADWYRQSRPRADIQAIAYVLLQRERHFGNGEALPYDLDRCDLQGILFFLTDGIHLEWSNFSYSNLTGANLAFAKVQHANFNIADLGGVNLSGAECQQATFQYSRLIAANLTLARLEGADFTGAILQGVNLAGAYLQGTVLYLATGLTDVQRQQCSAKGAIIEASI